jgi:phage terminase large subunit-like protein
VSASLAASLSSLSETERDGILAGLSDEELLALEFDWRFWARETQLAPVGIWAKWLVQAGRGFGKTRIGAEWIREQKECDDVGRFALVAPTSGDARDVMVEGDSGLLTISPPWDRPRYEPSKRRVTWKNGVIATLFSADEPDRLRGPQHSKAWGDELGAWKYAQDAWDNLMFGLRLGARPQVVATTTPRPIGVIRDLQKDPTCVITRGSTFDNRANLARSFLTDIVGKYEGTRLGRQELEGELLDDVPGALWQRGQIDALRVRKEDVPELVRLVVAVDPAVTSNDDSNETGIIAAGKGIDGKGYVLRDLSGRLAATVWPQRLVNAYHELEANLVVAEVNNGGDLVENTIRVIDKRVAYKAVHASRGKRTRAEPVAALYEQKRVHHVGPLQGLEDQMCAYVPDDYDGSPDRVDALVWALTELMLNPAATPRARLL